MVQEIKPGAVVKMFSWTGVVLDVLTGEAGKTILKVQTPRNIFRMKAPEYIEVDLAPQALELATMADMQAEIERLRRLQDIEISKLLAMLGEAQESATDNRISPYTPDR